jgi:mono/diheme cytochrome c family protein
MIQFNRASAFCVLGLLVVNPTFAAARPGQRDLATEVKAVFQAKCSECHGPRVPKPKGNFGYVLDLKRLASDPKKVVPSKPEESVLWQLVRDEMMPAEGARAGPLTKEQKETIRAWIEAGAPSTPIESSAPSPGNTAAERPPAPAAKRHFLDWLGNFHVVVIHFPIALLLAAAAGESWSAWRRVRQPSPAVRFCVLLGAGGAIVAAALGWLHAAGGYGAGSPSVLAWHRWLGTAIGAGSVILAVLSEIDSRRGVRGWRFRLLLLLVAPLVVAAGYLGGLMVYGEGYFDW